MFVFTQPLHTSRGHESPPITATFRSRVQGSFATMGSHTAPVLQFIAITTQRLFTAQMWVLALSCLLGLRDAHEQKYPAHDADHDPERR
jgi:hypothetical protein